VRYVRLLDGGLTDNIGARWLTRQIDSGLLSALQKRGVERFVVINVNAKSDADFFDR